MPRLTEAEGGKIKPANFRESFTEYQGLEIARCSLDPIYFTENYVRIQHTTLGRLPFNLYPYQRNLIHAYNRYQQVIALMRRQRGKALALDTPIPTPSGWTTMGRLKVGDRVCRPDGSPTAVTFVTSVMTDHDCYWVRWSNGESICADAQHLWTIRVGGVQQIVTTEVLKRFGQSAYVDLIYGPQAGSRVHVTTIIPAPRVPVRCIRVADPRSLFLCGNRMIPTHNTQTASAFLLWWAIFKAHQKILIARKDQTGANEIMRRLWYAYEELPWWIKPGVKKNDITHKEFSNGRGIRALGTTATTGRGLSIRLLYLDELAFVLPRIIEKFWIRIYPTIATGGKAIITRTPNTDEDIFSKIWFNAKPIDRSDIWIDPMAERQKLAMIPQVPIITTYEDEARSVRFRSSNTTKLEDDKDATPMREFRRFFRKWTNTPDRNGLPRGERYKKAYLAAGFKERQFLREFECAFVRSDRTLIRPQKLAVLKYGACDPLFVDRHNVRWYEEIQPNTAYAVVLDPSEGVELDDACIQVWEIPRLKQVAEWNSNKVNQPGQVDVLRRVLRRIRRTQESYEEHDSTRVSTYFSVERNGIGIGIINILELTGWDQFDGWFIDRTEQTFNIKGQGWGNIRLVRWRGLITRSASKRRFAADFKSLIERNIFVPRRKYLISQLKTFVRDGRGWGGKGGEKDDIVMSCVIMMMLLDELRRHESDLDDRVALEDIELPYEEGDETNPLNQPMMPQIDHLYR